MCVTILHATRLKKQKTNKQSMQYKNNNYQHLTGQNNIIYKNQA